MSPHPYQSLPRSNLFHISKVSTNILPGKEVPIFQKTKNIYVNLNQIPWSKQWELIYIEKWSLFLINNMCYVI